MTLLPWAVLSSGPFGALWLEALLRRGAVPLWTATGAARPAGRGLRLRPMPVEETALRWGIPLVSSPEPEVEALDLCSGPRSLGGRDTEPPEVLFVVDCGRRIREPLLSRPPRGCLNLHPSLLPDLRGAAPIPRALLRGDRSAGTSLFRLVEAMDAGPVLDQAVLEIAPTDDAGTLMGRLADLSAQRTLAYLEDPESFPAVPQGEKGVTLAPKILPEETRLSWDRPASEVWGTLRAFSPRPGAWTLWRGKRLRILGAEPAGSESPGTPPGRIRLTEEGDPRVTCGTETLILRRVQPEGKAPLDAREWARGLRLREGEGFDDPLGEVKS